MTDPKINPRTAKMLENIEESLVAEIAGLMSTHADLATDYNNPVAINAWNLIIACRGNSRLAYLAARRAGFNLVVREKRARWIRPVAGRKNFVGMDLDDGLGQAIATACRCLDPRKLLNKYGARHA